MDVSVSSDRGAPVVAIKGEVDLYSAPQVRDAILGAAEQRPRALLVDLSGVSYMDSSGVATLVEGLQRSRGYGGRFLLFGLEPAIREVFRFARLEQVFEICETAEEALGRIG